MVEVDTPVPAARFKSTWTAAMFGLLVGTTMVYVPYQFGAEVYRYIYDYTRWLGAGFLASGLVLGITALYPTLPRWVDLIARVLLIGSIGIYWWNAVARMGGLLGTVIYPLLIVGLVLEAFPRLTRRWRLGTFPAGLGIAAMGVGLVMALVPHRIPVPASDPLLLALRGLGVWFVMGGLGVAWSLYSGRTRALRWTIASLVPAFATLAAVLVTGRAWVGLEMYVTFAGSAVVFLVLQRVQFVPSIRWRLWRGMVIAACLPLLVLGALASVLMQRAIEAQTLDDARAAAVAEVEWLTSIFHSQREALVSHAALPSFLEAVRARDEEVLALSVQVLGFRSSGLEAVYIADATGAVIARTTLGVPATESVADREFFQRAQTEGFFVSRPYRAADGLSRVSMAVWLKDQQGPLGVLVGTLSVAELSERSFATSQPYAVRVIDRRDGAVLRANHAAHSTWVPPAVASGLATADEGDFLGADDRNRQVLVVWSRVPNTEWLVLASQDVAEAFAFVTRMGLGAVTLVTAAVLLALLLSQLAANEVTRRMRRVREAAEALSRGELQRRVEPEGNDELTTLAASFNQMAEQIQSAQTELERINVDLQSAVRVRDEFLSMASHELRTPLTPLKATVQTVRKLLSRADEKPDQTRLMSMLDRVDRQADRLALLVGDMLDTSRIRSGRFSLQPAPMDLCALVAEVLERTRSVSESNAARLRIEMPVDGVRGEWDAARLEQVVVNLVENAFRYSPQGGEILVRVTESAERVRISVIDSGIGIPPENLHQVFEPFFRGSNAAARHYGGLGLGLHICKEIVSRHDGRIWAESDGAGKGTRFHVELPRSVPAAARDSERAA